MFDDDMRDLNDLDYEDMDDLPLLDHIEWNHYPNEDEAVDDSDSMFWLEE
jgi:hypothetical protein